MVQISTPLRWPVTGEWAPREALFVKLLWPLVLLIRGRFVSLKQERRSEGSPARRWTDEFTRRPTDVQYHHVGQGQTVDVDDRRQGSIVENQQSSKVAISTSGDVIFNDGGGGEAAVDGRGAERRRRYGLWRGRSAATHAAVDRRQPVRLRLCRLRHRQGIILISFTTRRHSYSLAYEIV